MERHTNGAGASSLAAGVVKVRLADPPRNGLPWGKPYTWRPGEAERQAEVSARLAEIRGRILASRRWRGRVGIEAVSLSSPPGRATAAKR